MYHLSTLFRTQATELEGIRGPLTRHGVCLYSVGRRATAWGAAFAVEAKHRSWCNSRSSLQGSCFAMSKRETESSNCLTTFCSGQRAGRRLAQKKGTCHTRRRSEWRILSDRLLGSKGGHGKCSIEPQGHTPWLTGTVAKPTVTVHLNMDSNERQN